MKKAILFILLFMAFTAFSQEKKMWAKSIINQKAPDLIVEQWLTEKPDTKGKFVLVDFWATWCGPCKKTIPELNNFKKEFQKDLVIIGVSDETKENVNKLVSPKIEYYSAIDTKRTMYNSLEIQGIPHCILINPQGIVCWEGFPLLDNFELTSKVIKECIEKYKK